MSSKSLSSEDPLFCRDREQLLLVGSKMKRMFQDVSLTISSEPIIHFRAMVLIHTDPQKVILDTPAAW